MPTNNPDGWMARATTPEFDKGTFEIKEVDSMKASSDKPEAVADGHDADSGTELQALHITIERLKAFLVKLGYGRRAIKRILESE